MIVGIVLAAGASTRMGQPKLLLPYRGRTILEAAYRPFLKAPSVDRVIVVLGAFADEIVRRGVLDERLVVAHNREWRRGMASSIRTAMRHIGVGVTAILLGLGDCPCVPVSVIERLCATYRETRPRPLVLVPTHGGRRGHPVLFSGRLREALLRLRGDVGARGLIRGLPAASVLEVPTRSRGILLDCDTPEEYERLQAGVSVHRRCKGPRLGQGSTNVALPQE